MSDLEIRGLPPAYVATTEFISGANAQAKALGFAHTPIYVAHPIQDRTDAEMTERGDATVEEVVAKIVNAE